MLLASLTRTPITARSGPPIVIALTRVVAVAVASMASTHAVASAWRAVWRWYSLPDPAAMNSSQRAVELNYTKC